MWDIILNPMVTLLALMYSVFGNNVIIAIVVLTVIIRMAMYPLLAKQQESSKAMQELQPRLKKLQEKYKDDREKLAQEQMKLYQEHGINPFAGCLPLFIQFPIFIALYQAIFFALASTPFQLVDLSERLMIPGLDGLIPLQNVWLGMRLTEAPTPPSNPVYALALPLLVMVTTYIQFKVSQAQMGASKPADSKEDDGSMASQMQNMSQSMGTIMPIMFGFISLSLSVGLAVYFITSNLVGIAQYSPAGKRILDGIFGGGRKKKGDEDIEDAKIVATDKTSKKSGGKKAAKS